MKRPVGRIGRTRIGGVKIDPYLQEFFPGNGVSFYTFHFPLVVLLFFSTMPQFLRLLHVHLFG